MNPENVIMFADKSTKLSSIQEQCNNALIENIIIFWNTNQGEPPPSKSNESFGAQN